MTRGIKHDVDRFITELQGKYMPYDFNGEKTLVQLAVRPIQLWELVFPEPTLNTVCKTLFDDTTTRNGMLTYHKRNQKYLWALRKALNSENIPNSTLFSTALPMPIYKNNIEIAGIGIKKDEYKDGTECL